ncbi:deoxyribonuclease I-like 1-like [Plectropomus leopardus]|uniref:deoxyribonuclease I-like 1-like n=1 Tax=Plectropomus leopardus TaxID=160734 RepID=UPI001C4C7365|nr:deoxyribonuclease I-like 1-like [Plectropomus leopardus]
MRAAVLLFVAGLCVLNVTSSLKICAFNVQSFGESKANNKKVMGILLQILSRCDLSLIQEVRDSKGAAIQALVKALNGFDKSNSYSYVESERLGRKTYKEQYVYIYRNNVLTVKEHYQYPKLEGEGTNETDVFSREPFIVRFHSPTTLVKDFVLIGQHTCPRNAMKEIDELYTVFKGIHKKWKTDNVMILGDLNAGCNYVTIKGWRTVRLRSDPKFWWLIGDEQDTTVRQKTHCAYDRIIVHGREMISSIVPGSAQPFNFKESFHLTEEEALEVSDHFPVEVELKTETRTRQSNTTQKSNRVNQVPTTMSSLSGKSAQEISELLDEYGIKHGPVVDSTRSLYERKLKEAMAKGKRAKPSSDKTYYREEEEEITYVYRTPPRSDGAGDSGSYLRSRPEWSERDFEHETAYSGYARSKPEYRGREFVDKPYMYDTPSTYRSSYLNSPPMKTKEAPKTAPESSRLIPLWVQFVFFLAVAVFLYLVFSNMETNESIKVIE